MSWDYGMLSSEIYELDKPIGHSFGDVEYYTRSLSGVTGPILEPATGTGRILIPLLEAGHDVEGFDISPDMLAICRQHCRERGLNPDLHDADMTTFVRPAAYEAVIIPTGSIVLLDGRTDTQKALACFYESLAPGGQLIVDVPAPQLVTETEPMRYWRRDSFLWTLQTMHVEHDAAANQTTYFLRYDKWQDGTLVASELQPFRLQRWSLQEFEDLLYGAGFTGVRVTADWKDCAPGPSSETWTFHSVRP